MFDNFTPSALVCEFPSTYLTFTGDLECQAVFQVLFLKVQNDATMHGVLLERNGVYLACSQPSHAL
jgi:hypothetical protein